jgi:hypothetical protein
MPHHFTKTTVSATFWCNKCGKDTHHRVDYGRRGPCMACMAKLEVKQPPKSKPAEQSEMFEQHKEAR